MRRLGAYLNPPVYFLCPNNWKTEDLWENIMKEAANAPMPLQSVAFTKIATEKLVGIEMTTKFHKLVPGFDLQAIKLAQQ